MNTLHRRCGLTVSALAILSIVATGVAEAELSGKGFLLEKVFEVLQFSRASANLKFTVVNHGDTGGVIPAIFQSFQTAHDQGNGITGTNVSKYAAHSRRIAWGRHKSCQCEITLFFREAG